MDKVKSFIYGCITGLILCLLSTFLGVNKYVERLNKPLIDSLEQVKQNDIRVLDSLGCVLDSLKAVQVSNDTIYINLKQNENKSLNNVDSIPKSKVDSSIRSLLYR